MTNNKQRLQALTRAYAALHTRVRGRTSALAARLPLHVKESLYSKARAQDAARARNATDVLKTLDAFHSRYLRCLESEGHSKFYPMQLCASNLLIRALFVTQFGRKRMRAVAAVFSAKLEELGYALIPAFLSAADRKAIARGRSGDLVKRALLLQARRQYGKSMILHYGVACALMTFRRKTPYTVLLTSNTADLNKQNRDIITAQLEALGARVSVDNASEVRIAGTRNVMYVRRKSIRGVRPDLVVVDEGAFVEPQLYTRMIGPLLPKHPHRALVVVTTPNGGNHAWTAMLAEGTVPFFTCVVQEVCDACSARGKRACLCLVHYAPDVVVDEEIKQETAALYSMDPAARDEELLGLTATQSAASLAPAEVAYLTDDTALLVREDLLSPAHGIVYLSVDPSPNDVSAYALLAAVRDTATGATVVVHLDNETFGTRLLASADKLLTAAVRSLARRFPNHTLVTLLEANGSRGEAERMAQVVTDAAHAAAREGTPLRVLHHTYVHQGATRPGFLTTNQSQLAGWVIARDAVRTKKLRLAAAVTCAGARLFHAHAAPEATVHARVQQFAMQLLNIQETQGTRERTVSGKRGRDGGAANDDLGMCLLNLLHGMYYSDKRLSVVAHAVP